MWAREPLTWCLGLGVQGKAWKKASDGRPACSVVVQPGKEGGRVELPEGRFLRRSKVRARDKPNGETTKAINELLKSDIMVPRTLAGLYVAYRQQQIEHHVMV